MKFISILKKELCSYCASPGLYVIIAVFLIVTGYCFYTNLVMAVLLQGSAVPVDMWEQTFSDYRYLLMLLLPLISMRAFAEENRLGTLELLMTSPVRIADIVSGKYAACLTILACMLGLTLIYPVLFSLFAQIQILPLAAAYLGVFLLGALCLACGVFISSLTESQITAAIVTMGVLLTAWFFDGFGSFAGGRAGSLLMLLSIQKHFFTFVQGVITGAGIASFVTLMLCCLVLAGLTLRMRHRDGRRIPFIGRHLTRGTAMGIQMAGRVACCLVVFFSVSTLAGKYAGRIDTTPDKRHSLAPETVQALQRLTDSYHLTVCTGRDSRLSFVNLLELLRQSSRHFFFRLLDAEHDAGIATAMGIALPGSGRAQYRQRHELLTDVHESSIARSVLMLAGSEARMIRTGGVFGADPAGPLCAPPHTLVGQTLTSRGFQIAPLALDGQGDIPKDTAMVLIGNARGDFPGHFLPAIERFFLGGGAVMLVLPLQPEAELADFINRYNVEVLNALVVDTRNHAAEDITTPLIFISREHPAARQGAPPALFPQARPVQVGTQPYRGLTWAVVAQSGRGTWADTGVDQALANSAAYDKNDGDVYGPVSVGVSIATDIRSTPQAPQGRMLLLGNDRFMHDHFFELLGNRDLFLGILQWLTEDRSIAWGSYRPAGRGAAPVMLHMTRRENSIVFWVAVVLMPVFFVCAGIAAYVRLRTKK